MRGFRVKVSDGATDRHRWVTYASFGGLLLAALLALIGGLPVDIPMPTHVAGWVEPTCGLTRGSTAIVRGDFALAWRYNPASFLVVAAGIAGLLRWTRGRLTGRWINVAIRWNALAWSVIGILVLALWAYQQQRANFIINARI